jgi:hypothetical protein
MSVMHQCCCRVLVHDGAGWERVVWKSQQGLSMEMGVHRVGGTPRAADSYPLTKPARNSDRCPVTLTSEAVSYTSSALLLGVGVVTKPLAGTGGNCHCPCASPTTSPALTPSPARTGAWLCTTALGYAGTSVLLTCTVVAEREGGAAVVACAAGQQQLSASAAQHASIAAVLGTCTNSSCTARWSGMRAHAAASTTPSSLALHPASLLVASRQQQLPPRW